MPDTTRTRADRVQQLAGFLAQHPEVDVDFSDNSTISPRPVLSFYPKTSNDVEAVVAALGTSTGDWNRTSIASGFVSLDSGALGYASVFIQLPRVQQPVRVVAPEIAGLFA